MASYQFNNPGTSWLNLGESRIDQPLERSARVGRTDPAMPGAAGAVRGSLPGQTKAAFVLAQNRAVERATQKARSVLSAVSGVDIPSGEQISLVKSALASDRSFWTGTAENRAQETTHLARLPNLARSRTSRSLDLAKTGTDDIAAGTYTIKLTEGEAEPLEFDFTVSYGEPFGDDNELILNRLANSLEQFGKTLSARVVEDSELDANGFSVPTLALEIRSRHTGPVDTYTLEDVSGNLVAGLDLDGLHWGGLDLTYLRGTQRSTPYGIETSGFIRDPEPDTLEPRVDWTPAQSSPQINRSRTLAPEGRSDLPAGRYKFRVDQDGQSRELILDIDYHGFFPDNNTTILTNLAQMLEGSGEGLLARANVGEALDQDDQTDSGVTLYVSTAENGQDGEFTLRDVENDLINRLGLDRVFQPRTEEEPAPAGWLSENFSDRFRLDQTRLLTQGLQSFMDDPRKLTVAPAREPVMDQVESVVQAHNSLMATLMEEETYLGNAVRGGLARELSLHRNTFSEIGLEVSSAGFVILGERIGTSLDQDLGKVREGLTGETGFLTVVREHLGAALGHGFNAYRTTRPGLIANDPPGTFGSGYDPYSGSILGRIRVGGDGPEMDRNQWVLSRMT